MARRVIGLDVGTYSIKVTHLESRNRATDFEVVAYAEKLLSDFSFTEEEGSLPIQLQQQQAALLALKAEGFFEEGMIISGLSGADAQVRSLSVPFTNTKKIQAVLGGLLDAQLPLDIDDLVLSWFLQKPRPHLEKANVEAQEQNQILVAFAKKISVDAYLKLLQVAKLNPRYITHKAAGLFDLLQHLIRKKIPGSSKTFAIIDLGFHSSSICVGSLDRILSARTVLRGGYDVTQNLMEKLRLSFPEAEKRKIETGFIETETEKAKLLEQHLMSEALKESYLPVIRELRQTVLALQSQGQEECTQIFLTGGGSKIKNLDQYFYEMLKIKTHAENDLKVLVAPNIKIQCPEGHAPEKAEAALATSYAISGSVSGKKQNHFDLRKGEFTWRGELTFLRSRGRILLLWGSILLVLLLGYGFLKNSLTAKEAENLKADEMAACEGVLGKKIDSGPRCLSMIKEQILGQGDLGIPEKSAADIYLEISKAISPQIQLKVTELDIADQKLRLNGETSGFEAVDTIYAALAKVPCVVNVEKGRARQVLQAVHFQMTADLKCQSFDDDEIKGTVKKRTR